MEVKLIDVMASDLAVVRSARVSTTGEGSLVTESNDGLINYLVRERHASPFEHGVFTFFVKAPIFVAREFMRHRIASYNEESGRYRELSADFYLPLSNDRPLVQIGKTGAYTFEEEASQELRDWVVQVMDESYNVAWGAYRAMLDSGVAKEVARMVLPVGIYSSWYVTINARSLMNFLSLRTASNAQWEIRQIAEMMEEHFKLHMPVTYAAWVKNGRKSI
jgi:thymidylate synthase (FAD)